MNTIHIKYCYPTSPMAEKLGKAGFYCEIGAGLVISPVFKTIHGAEGFCRNNCLQWECHSFHNGADVCAVHFVPAGASF